MKLRRKIVIVIVSLISISVLGFGILWLVSRMREQEIHTDHLTENTESSVEVPDGTPAESTTQPTEEVLKDTGESTEITLVDLEDYSEAPADNGCPYYVKVNRQENVVTVYALENGYYTKPIRAMVCSVGKNGGTPTGTYQTGDKHTWCSLVGGVYGQYAYRITGQIMFHSVPYYSMDKGNLETAEYNKLGEAASLGCVRLSVTDAKWIYDNCPQGTLVTIYDSDYAGPLGKPVAEKLDEQDGRSGWDPTDPDVENPWNEGNTRILGGGRRTIERGCTFQPACGVIALDSEGNDQSDQIRIQGDVNAMEIGVYPITYYVESEDGTKITVDSEIQVIDTIPPEIMRNEAEITLNRTEASETNCRNTILQYITAIDAGQELSDERLHVDFSALEGQDSGSFPVFVSAEDVAGNVSEPVTLTVSLDRLPPVIYEPEIKEFTGESAEDIKEQLLAAVRVEDDFSGVAQVNVSWVRETAADNYTLLYTARDYYGNVSSEFYYDFVISYESNE